MNLTGRVIFLSVLIVILNSNFSLLESSAYGYKIGIGPVEFQTLSEFYHIRELIILPALHGLMVNGMQ